MITLVNIPTAKISSSNIQSMFYTKDNIKALAAQLVANQVEAHIDMINDGGQKEYSTFAQVDSCIQAASETVKDYIEDLLHDFRTSLLEQVALVNVTTDNVILKPDDEIDACVTVEMK